MYFVDSWMTRSPVFPVTNPNDPLVGLLIALLLVVPPQFGWFSTLNASTRNSTRWLPVIGTFFRTPKSRFHVDGYRREFRVCTPNVPAAGRANAAGSNQAALLVNGPRVIVGSPTRFQN